MNLAGILESMRPRLTFQGLIGRRLESKGETDGRTWESRKLLIITPGDEIPVTVTEDIFARFAQGQVVSVTCLAKSYEVERKGGGPKGRGVSLVMETISLVSDVASGSPDPAPLAQGRLATASA